MQINPKTNFDSCLTYFFCDVFSASYNVVLCCFVLACTCNLDLLPDKVDRVRGHHVLRGEEEVHARDLPARVPPRHHESVSVGHRHLRAHRQR